MKKVFLTGGTGTLGRAIIEEMLGDYDIIFTYYRNQKMAENIEKHAGTMERSRDRAMPCRGVMLDLLAADGSTECQLKRHLENVDILVNNACYSDETGFEEINIIQWRQMLESALIAPATFCQGVVRGMKDRKWGRIINIASIGGQWGGWRQVHYAAAKAGLISLTRSLARLYAKDGITVNAVSPGLIDGGMSDKEMATEEGKAKLANIPLGRLAKPGEIASMVKYLASEDAGYITGQTINVNGGMLFSS